MDTAMRKLLAFLIALGAIVFAVVAPCQAQLSLMGAGTTMGATPSSNYIGPGDITFNGSAANVKEFWSCARAVNNAHASTSTSLCDLVDPAAPTVVICTLHDTPSGFVDLSTAGCGGTTPAAKCAATSTTFCNVSQVYGQIGGIGNATNATAAGQPVLVFSGLGGLPVMKCTAASCILSTSGTITLAQPFVMSAVYIRNPTSTATGQIVGGGTSTTSLDSSSSGAANRFACAASGGGGSAAATDAVWHGGIALFNTTTASIISADGSNNASQNCGTGGLSAEAIRLFRGAGGINQMDGSIAEAMVIGSTASASDFTNWFNNANGSNGYNGGL
jgi:hypothetical protein